MPTFIVECVYCGIAANGLDHIIPVSYENNGRKGASYAKELVVPCCSECNNRLSNFFLPTIAERAEYLIGAYNKKYKKILKLPTWTKEELKKLGPSLRKTIMANQKHKELILEKITHLADVSTMVNLTPLDVWDMYPDDIFTKFRGFRYVPMND